MGMLLSIGAYRCLVLIAGEHHHVLRMGIELYVGYPVYSLDGSVSGIESKIIMTAKR